MEYELRQHDCRLNVRLVLGVLDVAYSDASNGGKETTTGAVADILEKNYAVMGTFFDDNQDKIANVLAESVADAIVALGNGAKVAPTFGGEQKIEAAFRTFIYSNTMQKKLDAAGGGGVVSQAAQNGVSHRRKKPYAKRDARPAFVDTGLYVQSFRAWVEK